VVVDPAQQNAAAQLAQQILPNTKLPEFYGLTGKDIISAMKII
jgi:hypothetical protein